MSMNQRILIIEDEKNLARFVELELQHEGYEHKFVLMDVLDFKRQQMRIGMLFC